MAVQSLYLDECLPPILQSHLQSGAPQALTVDYAGKVARGRSDADHLQRAVRNRAVLVTYNIKDFQYLHRLWKTLYAWGQCAQSHGGILGASAAVPVEELAAEILGFLMKGAPPPLDNTMYVYVQATKQWRRERK